MNEPATRRLSIVGLIGIVSAIVIVVASVLVRRSDPPDPAADVAKQREAVTRFHESVEAGRWREVYLLTTEPPAESASAFATLMREQVAKHGRVTSVTIDEMTLLRSRTVPLLEVRETVKVTEDGREKTTKNTSYFARRGTRWLFAFSAPR